MTHTPGPWTFRFEAEDKEWAIVLDKTGGIVANVNTETGPDFVSAPSTRKMPAEANAHLIVTAPELLSLGETAVELLYAQYMEYALADPNRREDIIDLMMKVVSEWRSIAAKAKGEK